MKTEEVADDPLCLALSIFDSLVWSDLFCLWGGENRSGDPSTRNPVQQN